VPGWDRGRVRSRNELPCIMDRRGMEGDGGMARDDEGLSDGGSGVNDGCFDMVDESSDGEDEDREGEDRGGEDRAGALVSSQRCAALRSKERLRRIWSGVRGRMVQGCGGTVEREEAGDQSVPSGSERWYGMMWPDHHAEL
jgi:hypothetical protein